MQEYNKQRSNYDPDIEEDEEKSLTKIQKLIKDNHIKLQDQEIAEDLPLEQSPETRGDHKENLSKGGEDLIKDETEATGQSPKGMTLIEEDIIPDMTEAGVGNNEVTTEMLVTHVIKTNIEQ